MNYNKHFSCIIPFYNEGNNVLSVVSALSNIKQVTQIICADDGSTDNTSFLIKKRFPNALLVRFARNHGKAEAVFHALQKTTNSNILLLDGDLRNIVPNEIENALLPFQSNPSIDMVVLKVKGDNIVIDSFLRKYIFQGGNRILKKSDLSKIMRIKPSGYQLEVATNQYMMKHNKNVFWVECSAFNPHKTRKLPLLQGLVKDLQMDKSIIPYLGLAGYLKQMFFFCRSRLVIS